MRNSPNPLPFPEYAFTGTKYFTVLYSEYFRDFVTICGSSITNIVLDCSDYANIFIAEDYDPLPKLKDLSVAVHHAVYQVEKVLEYFYKSTSNLKSFTLSCQKYISPKTTDFIAAQLPQTVTVLKLNAFLSSDNYHQFAKRNLSLTTFHVRGSFESEAATTFLESMSPTLKHFYLKDELAYYTDPRLKFSIMKEVETATLSHYPLNCTFEKYFPKLKVLDLSCMRYESLASILRNYTHSSNITTLTLPRTGFFLWFGIKTVVELVGRVFDKLTTLVMFDSGRDNNAELFVIREVFDYIRHIESLTIVLRNCNVVNMDIMLTGLSTFPESMSQSAPIREYPSLVCLTGLKTLTLTREPSSRKGKKYLTDLSVDFAFMYMPCLKSVTVRGLGFYPTPSCVSRLRDKGTVIEIHN
jgi:hypothetical protein